MKHISKLAMIALLGAVSALGSPAIAQEDDDGSPAAAAAFLAVLGIAALSHHQSHYHEGMEPRTDEQRARFERGYRDGLHNEPFDNSSHAHGQYALGYQAGHKERANRLAHRNHAGRGVDLPRQALRNCRMELADTLGLPRDAFHMVWANQEGASNYYIEMAAGHRHIICGVGGDGQLFSVRDGRLPRM